MQKGGNVIDTTHNGSTPEPKVSIHHLPDRQGRHLVEVRLGDSAPWHSAEINPFDDGHVRQFNMTADRTKPHVLRRYVPDGTPPLSPDWLTPLIAAEAAKLPKSEIVGNPDAEPAEGFRVEMLSAPDNRKAQSLIVLWNGAEVERDKLDIEQAWQRKALFDRVKGKLGTARDGNGLEQQLHDALFDAVKRWETKQSGGNVEFQRLTHADLDNGDFAVTYHVRDILIGGQPTITAGGKKELKTSCILDLHISLATGEPFLGHFPVLQQARSMFMSGESGLGTIQETARRQCHAKGTELAKCEGLFFSSDLPKLGSTAHLEALRRLIRDDGIEFLTLDPAYLMMPGGDAGNLFVTGELLRDVSLMVAGEGCTLNIVHHTKKNIANPHDPPQLESIAWAGFQEFARAWILVARRETYEPGTGQHRLWLSTGGSAGHGGLWGVNVNEGHGHGNRYWQTEVLKASEVREAVADEREQAKADKKDKQAIADVDAVVRACARLPGHRGTKTDIKERSGLQSTRFGIAFATALNQGRLKQSAEQIVKANNQAYDAYEVVDPGET